MAVRSSGSRSRPMNDLMRSVADIPGDADDDLPEISPELVLVDPELARRVREDAAAAAAAARRRDRALRLVRGATRVDDRVDDAEPAEQAIVPRPAVTEGSPDADDRERASQVEDDELIVPRAVGPTESSATEVSDPVGEPEVEASSASQAVVPTPAVVADVAPESELVPGALPTVSEPVGEPEVEAPSAPSQAVVAEAGRRRGSCREPSRPCPSRLASRRSRRRARRRRSSRRRRWSRTSCRSRGSCPEPSRPCPSRPASARKPRSRARRRRSSCRRRCPPWPSRHPRSRPMPSPSWRDGSSTRSLRGSSRRAPVLRSRSPCPSPPRSRRSPVRGPR